MKPPLPVIVLGSVPWLRVWPLLCTSFRLRSFISEFPGATFRKLKVLFSVRMTWEAQRAPECAPAATGRQGPRNAIAVRVRPNQSAELPCEAPKYVLVSSRQID
jgi:hypothetical protein